MSRRIPSSNIITFNESNIQRQYFYLPYPVTQHILWNANGEVLNKLYKTCKYFYKKRPYCIVDGMKMDSEGQIYMKIDGRLFYFDDVTSMAMLDNIWVTKKLVFVNQTMISRIARCYAEYIDLNIPSLPLNDFITLTKSGNVSVWWSPLTSITDDDGKPLSLEKLLFHLPNAKLINANVHYVIQPNPVNMALVPRKNKIKSLYLRCDNPFNADLLFDLLKETLAPRATVYLHIDDQVAVENFQAEMGAKLKSWIPLNEKPMFDVNYLMI